MTGHGSELLSVIFQKAIRQPKDSVINKMYDRVVTNLTENVVVDILDIAPKYVNINWKHVRGQRIDNWVCISHRAVRFCSKYGDEKGIAWYEIYDVFYMLNEFLKEYGEN